MVKAIFKDKVLAESSNTEMVEGNHYFPPSDINKEYFKKNDFTTECHWKGTANYYDIEINGEKVKNGAWYYAQPKEKAQHIKNYVAFDKSSIKIE
jgi:uncharacterized protein (DUF427 family)